MSDQSPLPRFKNPLVSEVAMGVQFQAPMLTPVHLGLFYQRIKARFPTVAVQAPLQASFETFGSGPMVQLTFPVLGSVAPFQPRMWFVSADDASLIQLQSGRLFFNWRGGLQQNAYPHFDAVQSEFMKALDALEALSRNEQLGDVIINQCELIYVNPLPISVTDVPLSEPHRIFRIWSDACGEEWGEPPEDISFNIRYRFNDKDGTPFGRLTAALSSGWAQDGSPAFHLVMTARGQPIGSGHAGITAFHEYAHQAIVRCFAAITTPEMHQRWGRYQ
jgi:uncharacterized protein (TIGR04255 family)